MAIQKTQKGKQKPRSPILILVASTSLIAVLYLASSLLSTNGLFSFANSRALRDMIVPQTAKNPAPSYHKYLYWGDRIDCPGKHCETCAGLGHQESSLRCALEEAMYLQRWETSSFATDSMFDLELISSKVPVIMDNSKMWHQVVATSMKLGSRGVAHVQEGPKPNSIFYNKIAI